MSISPSLDQRAEIVAVAVDQNTSLSVKATLRPGRARRLDRPAHRGARLFGIPQVAFEIEDLRRRRSPPRRAPPRAGTATAPRKVFIVRWPSGVTKIRQRAVGGSPARAGVSKSIPTARMSCAKTSPSWSSATWPMKRALARRARRGRRACWPPSRPRSRAPGPSRRRARRARSASTRVMPPRLSAELLDQLVVARGHHVDDGIADRDHVVAGFGHFRSSPNLAEPARLSGGSSRGQARVRPTD